MHQQPHSPPITATTHNITPLQQLSGDRCYYRHQQRQPTSPSFNDEADGHRHVAASTTIVGGKRNTTGLRRQKRALAAPLKRSRVKDGSSVSSPAVIAPRLGLESLRAVDPSKSVGSVLMEAGIGAEFHAAARIKTLPLHQQQSHATMTISRSNGSGDASRRPRRRQRGSASAISPPNINNSATKVGASVTASFTRVSSRPAQIPCSYKGCQKVFTTKSAMRKHVQIHGPRQHVCGICSRYNYSS